MHIFNYDFLQDTFLPVQIVNLASNINVLRLVANERQKVHKEIFQSLETIAKVESVKASNAIDVYDSVIKSFDDFLKEHGYERDGSVYKVLEGNDRTIALFCHFGITCVLLSRLWNVSPFVPLQFLAMAPTSLTEVVSEEREKGTAIFRTLRVGDITHLTMGKETPSFSARFCEMYENEHERH